jgi:hypothetical protein
MQTQRFLPPPVFSSVAFFVGFIAAAPAWVVGLQVLHASWHLARLLVSAHIFKPRQKLFHNTFPWHGVPAQRAK